MARYELAQLNIAHMKEPLESPTMADFVANLDRINALAESSPGFVWRLKSDEGNATAFRPLGEETLVNVSVWRDVEALNKVAFAGEVDVTKLSYHAYAYCAENYALLDAGSALGRNCGPLLISRQPLTEADVTSGALRMLTFPCEETTVHGPVLLPTSWVAAGGATFGVETGGGAAA